MFLLYKIMYPDKPNVCEPFPGDLHESVEDSDSTEDNDNAEENEQRRHVVERAERKCKRGVRILENVNHSEKSTISGVVKLRLLGLKEIHKDEKR